MVVVLLLAFVVSQSCQKSQIRLTKDQAIARAEQQVDFEATRQAGPPAAPGGRRQAVLDRLAVDPAQGQDDVLRARRGPHRREHGQGRRREGPALAASPAGLASEPPMTDGAKSGGAPAPEARKSLVDVAEDALRTWLATGRHRSGERLPPEQELSAAARHLARHAAHRAAPARGERRDRAPPGQRHVRRPGRLVDARRGTREARVLQRAGPAARREARGRRAVDRGAAARPRARRAVRPRRRTPRPPPSRACC